MRKPYRRAKLGIDNVSALQANDWLWDTTRTGLRARRQRSTVITYEVFYRTADGTQRFFKLGRHGPLTPTTARKAADVVLGDVARGHDPARAKQLERGAVTVTELSDRFLREHVQAKRKASSAESYTRVLKRVVLPAIGNHKVAAVVRDDIEKFHNKLAAHPALANFALAVTSAMFGKAEYWKMRAQHSNPCDGIEKYRLQARERFLTEAEMERLGAALSAYTASPQAVAGIKLLALTGARVSEILALQWSMLDHGDIRLPDSKSNRPKTIYLSEAAKEVLRALPRIKGNEYCIASSARKGEPLVNLDKAWSHIRTAAGLHDLRLHDLRHSFASFAASNGTSLVIIGKMLGHSQPSTTAKYAHLGTNPVRSAATEVSGKIADAMKLPTTPAVK